MTSGGNASAGRLESADAAVVRRDADRAAAVAADASRDAARGDGCGFTAARPARSAREIPGIICAPVKNVVGLIGHEEFGRVGIADEDGAGGAQASDERSVGWRDVVSTQAGTGGASPTGDVNRTLDADRNAVERAEFFAAARHFAGNASGAAGAFGVEGSK